MEAIVDAEILAGEIRRDDIPPRPFPETRETVFFLLQDEYDRIIGAVRALWEENRRAQALAEIRRNERDSLSGPFLISLRREMEQAMGLGFTEEERWRPLRVPLFVWLFFGLVVPLAGVFLLVFRPRLGNRRNPLKDQSSSRRGSFRNVIILILSIGLALIFLEEGWGRVSMRRLSSTGRTAVLESTPAYRVPDVMGTVNARFGEGQPVFVSAYHLDWYYAESPDGRSGWVPREAVINY